MELNGWEDVRTILANPNLNFSGKMLYYHRSSPLTEMPSSWLEQSTKSMKIIYLKRSSQFPETATPLEWANDIPEIKPTEQLDEIESPSQSGKKKGQLPHSTLATLPTSYWLERDNPKSHIRASPANSTLPRCKDRLLNSPFGDPRKLIKIQQKRAIQARAAQAKYRSLNKKDTSSSKPRPSSAGATSKELNVDNRADLPKDFRKQVAVAEKLFGGERGDSDCDGHADSPSALDQLTYEERLTVMMMQIKNDRYE